MFSQVWADAFQRVFAPKILLFLLQGLKNTMYIAVVTIAEFGAGDHPGPDALGKGEAPPGAFGNLH